MAVFKERCPNCGGIIILSESLSIVECDYCSTTYSLSDLQKIKESISTEHTKKKENNRNLNENEHYESALDASKADEISIEELCKKAEMALESEQWKIANSYSDEIIRRNPKFAKAYLYRLLADCRIFQKEELAKREIPFDGNDNYRLLIRFADVYLKSEIEKYSDTVKQRYLEKSEKLNKEEQEKKRKKRIALLTTILIIIATYIIAGSIKNASYRVELFSVKITEKVNSDYEDHNVQFVFKFNINNESPHNANYLEGYITISDAEGTVLANGSTWFRGVIDSKNTNYFELSLDLDRSAATTRIWNTDFSDLVIKYRITEIHFDDGTIKEYQTKDVIVNK